jgi:hypothetical protein
MPSEIKLSPFPLEEACKAMTGAVPGALVITKSPGQWDALLQEAYNQGWILVEIADEVPVAAYRYQEPD